MPPDGNQWVLSLRLQTLIKIVAFLLRSRYVGTGLAYEIAFAVAIPRP
jgi:hypothetical protein